MCFYVNIWRKAYIKFLLFLHRMYWNEIQTLYAVRSRMMCLPRFRRIRFWTSWKWGIRCNITADGVESWWLTWWISWWVSSSKLSWVASEDLSLAVPMIEWFADQTVLHSVIRKFRITAADGKTCNTNYYNLSAITVVGNKVDKKFKTACRMSDDSSYSLTWSLTKLVIYIFQDDPEICCCRGKFRLIALVKITLLKVSDDL